MNKYIVKPEDLIGDIKGFPIEVVQKMVDYQEVPDVSVFQNKAYGTKTYDNGFNWADTTEGEDFWYDTIQVKDFKPFFQKYPKQEFDIVLTHSNGFQIFREPVLMEVCNHESFRYSHKRKVIGKLGTFYYAFGESSTGEIFQWNYARPIQPKEEPIIELTLQQIAEKFNIDSSKLRIKE